MKEYDRNKEHFRAWPPWTQNLSPSRLSFPHLAQRIGYPAGGKALAWYVSHPAHRRGLYAVTPRLDVRVPNDRKVETRGVINETPEIGVRA